MISTIGVSAAILLAAAAFARLAIGRRLDSQAHARWLRENRLPPVREVRR